MLMCERNVQANHPSQRGNRQAHHHTYIRGNTGVLVGSKQLHVAGSSPEADPNKKSASHARSRLPGNNFFLLIGRSAVPAPLVYGLVCRSLSFLQLLIGFCQTIVPYHLAPVQLRMNIARVHSGFSFILFFL